MSKINPIYIFIISLCLFLYSVFELNIANDKLIDIKEQNKQYIKVANKYNALQKAWGNNAKRKKTLEKRIEKFLRISNINNVNIIKSGKTIKIKIVNSNIKALHKFMNKILNEKMIIKKFSLTKSSLNLEIGQ